MRETRFLGLPSCKEEWGQETQSPASPATAVVLEEDMTEVASRPHNQVGHRHHVKGGCQVSVVEPRLPGGLSSDTKQPPWSWSRAAQELEVSWQGPTRPVQGSTALCRDKACVVLRWALPPVDTAEGQSLRTWNTPGAAPASLGVRAHQDSGATLGRSGAGPAASVSLCVAVAPLTVLHRMHS